MFYFFYFFFFQAEDGIRDRNVTGVQTCALPISHLPAVPGADGPGGPPVLRLERPSNRGLTEARRLEPRSSPERTPASELLEGDMELLGLMPGASNYTFLARLLGSPADGDPQRLVVYKPRRGEAPLWDFPPGTLCQRETAAFEVSQAGGFGFVPPTVLRDGPVGMGSVQAFVHHDFECTAFDLFESHAGDLRRIA